MADASVGRQLVRNTIRRVSDFLTYDRVFSQTSGASHFINVLKYSKERRQLFIADGDIPSVKTNGFSGWWQGKILQV